MPNKPQHPSFTQLAKVIFAALIALLLLGAFPAQFASAQGTTPAPDAATFLAQQGARISYSAQNGSAHFIGAPLNQPISVSAALPANASQSDVARGFLDQYGKLFGLSNQAQELSVVRQKTPNNTRAFVRFQQVYQGIPVLGGEMIVQVTASNQILSANGEISSGVKIGVAPSISASTAQQSALALISKTYPINITQLTATKPQLWVYDPILIGPTSGTVRLVWRMEVSSTNGQPIRELVLVDALTGSIALHFNQIHAALNRQTYTANNGSVLPGTLVCNESNPSCSTGDAHAQGAHINAGATYNFYSSVLGRDSIDNAGMALISTVHYRSPSNPTVPYANAFWNGTQMVYGDAYTFSQADDVVAHELTHGVTEHESGLFYFYQSGAINESLSDVFGEFVDQTDGIGNDTVGVKWLLGEDVSPGGSIRNMQNPPAFGDPDKMTSANYYKNAYCPDPITGQDFCDTGGVHINSGVNNKAAFLITDGGSFNGQTITGIGVAKAARIYYEVQTNLLTSGSDYADLYNALYQGCLNLIGTSGIISSDCQQVRNATLAVEMNVQPAAGYNPEAEICPAGQAPTNLFYDTFESGFANWSLAAISGSNQWTTVAGFYGDNAHSGIRSLYADDVFTSSNSAAAMVSGVTLPANAYLHFYHSYDLESPFDGGVIEYSVNGGGWLYGGGLIDSGQNNNANVISLGSVAGFTGASHGYVSTRLNLSSLAGQNVRFRWRLATDASVFYVGWWLDDVRIYTCSLAVTITGFTPTGGPVGTSVNISGTNLTGASAVAFNGTNASTFSVVSATSINATVPAGATTGLISVTTPLGTATSASNFTVTTPLAIGNYEETNANLTYSGNWLSYTGAGPKGGSFMYSNDPAAKVSLPITNDVARITVYWTQNTIYGAMALYQVVGGTATLVGNIPGTGPLAWAQATTFTLPAGTNRTLELRNTSANYIGFEAFDLLAAAPPPTPFAIGNYEETNANLTYAGSWLDYSGAGPKGGSFRYSNDPNARVSFSVVNTAERVIIYRTMYSGYGPVGVYVDGSFIGNMPTSTTLTWAAPYVIALTPNGNPRSIELRNTSSQYVGFEAFDVTLAPPPPTPFAIGNYEETNANLTYTGSWLDYSGAGPKGGSFKYSNDPNARVSFSVVNTAERVIIYRTLYTGYGPVGVYVDGSFIGNMPTSTTLTWAAPYVIALTPNGNLRSIELRNTSSQYVGFEAFDVALAPTPFAIGNYEETNANLTYSGNWVDYSGAGPKGGSFRYSNDPNARVNFSVVNTAERVIIYRTLYTGYGAVGVYVDGSFIGNMPTSTTLTWAAPYVIALTPNGNPRSIELRNTSSQYVGFEAFDVALAPTPFAVGNYEETNANLTYTGSWLDYSGAGPKGGSFRYSNDPNARVSFSVVNTAERVIIYRTLYTGYGPVGVYVDGSFIGNMPTSTTLTWAAPYVIALTPNGNPRSIELRNTSSQYVGFEAFDVALTPAPLGAGLYQETNAALAYSGTWSSYSGVGPNGGSLLYTNTLAAQVSFRITGDAFRLYRTKAYNRGPMEVCIDTILPCATVSNYDPGVLWNVSQQFGSLGAGTHNIVIRSTSASTSLYIDIDAIEVFATTPVNFALPSVTPTSIPTQVEVTATLIPTDVQPTATLPNVSPTPTLESSPEPSPTPLPSETPIPSPVPTDVPATPEPSPTPLPTDVPIKTPTGG